MGEFLEDYEDKMYMKHIDSVIKFSTEPEKRQVK